MILTMSMSLAFLAVYCHFKSRRKKENVKSKHSVLGTVPLMCHRTDKATHGEVESVCESETEI